ncbi:MAG: hypothetical protein IT378_13930 [Sandaracinaceae bacterium]|nr:hypothetical protein [Sandaracinaceae bacterium]MCC6875401.1 hypothetical protein [Sandaracinaceae bacterium]
METSFLVESSASCIEWVVALALVAVGATAVRKAEPRAGYLVIATGALWLLSSCCSYIPTLRWQLAPSEPGILDTLIPWVAFLFSAAGVLGVLGAAVVMARAITATGGAR